MGGTRTPWGDVVTEVVSATLSSGAFRCLDVQVSGDRAHPDYVHHRCDEAFYVLSGRFRITVGEQRLLDLDAGATVYVPRGLRRSLQATSATGRLLVIQTPGDEQDGVLAAPAQQQSGTAMSLVQALADGGIELILSQQSGPIAPSPAGTSHPQPSHSEPSHSQTSHSQTSHTERGISCSSA
ncbi:MAG TPA: cupin domain-containing protein [Jatrophihabitans sp.]|nr:cupin domain-containing protein [Jatrophihabitans sp.]